MEIDPSGRVIVNGEEVGQLELTRLSREQLGELETAGASLFRNPGSAATEVFDGQVLQGFIEKSNVSPIDELISIMVSSRQYEAARKVMTAIDDSMRGIIDLN